MHGVTFSAMLDSPFHEFCHSTSQIRHKAFCSNCFQWVFWSLRQFTNLPDLKFLQRWNTLICVWVPHHGFSSQFLIVLCWLYKSPLIKTECWNLLPTSDLSLQTRYLWRLAKLLGFDVCRFPLELLSSIPSLKHSISSQLHQSTSSRIGLALSSPHGMWIILMRYPRPMLPLGCLCLSRCWLPFPNKIELFSIFWPSRSGSTYGKRNNLCLRCATLHQMLPHLLSFTSLSCFVSNFLHLQFYFHSSLSCVHVFTRAVFHQLQIYTVFLALFFYFSRCNFKNICWYLASQHNCPLYYLSVLVHTELIFRN